MFVLLDDVRNDNSGVCSTWAFSVKGDDSERLVGWALDVVALADFAAALLVAYRLGDNGPALNE